jgi:hypothetical protein
LTAVTEGTVSDLLEELLDSIDRALVLLKARPEARYSGDIENLLRVRRILSGLDPEEIEALLEEEEE